MTDEPRIPDSVAGPITFALLILIGFFAIHSIEPPAALDANAPATEFSAARAMRDVREIAKAPHPLGSAENDRVREYLVGRLRELGVNPEVQTTTVARHTPFGPDTWAVVNNVVAKIPGTHPTGAVLIVAHYDSVPSSPGAGDNAASVAAILETIRALKVNRVLRNNLIVLFSDGEELGQLGAQGFVETSPALQKIKLVLNLEMRGDYGPSVMFQTKSDNSWLAAKGPIAPKSSFAESLDRTISGETDLNVFLDAGIDGITFGAIRGITRYHTNLDNVDLLDQRSLQDQGKYALSMARGFGTIDLAGLPAAGGAASYVPSGSLSYYLKRLVLPLAVLVPILLLGVIWFGIRDGQFTIGGIVAGFAIYAIAIAASIVTAYAVWRLTAMLAGWRMLPIGTTYGGFYYSVAANALMFGMLWAAYEQIDRRVDLRNLGVGALVVLAATTITTTISLPAARHTFWWPLLLATLAIGYRTSATGDRLTIRRTILTLVAVTLPTMRLAPSFAASADGTTHFLISGGLAAVTLFGLYIPYIDFLTAGRRWIVPGALGLLALAMIIKGNAASNFDATHPHPDSIFYFLDSDRGRARWVSLDSRPDTFTVAIFPASCAWRMAGETRRARDRRNAGEQSPANLGRFRISESRPNDRGRRASYQRAAA